MKRYGMNIAAGVILSFVLSLHVFAQESPVALLQRVADHMIAGLKSNQATLHSKPQVVYQLAYRYVVPYADLTEMSKRVLPPTIWNNATTRQKQQFQKEFTLTLIRTYASALASYQNQTIRFYPPRGGSKSMIEVPSDITSSDAPPIRVSYRMVNRGNGWRVYDLSVEGVSMLESFRSQFADILSRGNMDLLLSRMRGHNRGR